MSTLFISDIHLSPKTPKLTKLFINFLAQIPSTTKILYILGDLFELWIGDDDQSDFTKQISKALVQTDVKTYIMHGNRDFLLGEKFMQQSGCQLIADPTIIDLYGNQTLLTHGDTLCLNDEAYLRFRKIVRKPFIKKCFLSLPLSFRQSIAKRIRSYSKHQHDMAIGEVDPKAIQQLFDQHQVNHIIHGHIHQPTIHYTNLTGTIQQRIVLSDWGKSGNYLLIDKTGFRLTSFPAS